MRRAPLRKPLHVQVRHGTCAAYCLTYFFFAAFFFAAGFLAAAFLGAAFFFAAAFLAMVKLFSVPKQRCRHASPHGGWKEKSTGHCQSPEHRVAMDRHDRASGKTLQPILPVNREIHRMPRSN